MNNFNIYLYLLISSSFLFSDECLNLDCEGSQDFLCYFTELEDFNSHNECRDYAESNGKEFHGTSFGAEDNCVDPGCYCNENDNPHCFWQESNDCVNEDCGTDPHFSCYHIEVEDLNNYNECIDYAESNGKEFHGTWYNAEDVCVDPGCFCHENDNYCNWIENGADCVNWECETEPHFSCEFTELADLNSYNECRDHAESSGREFHGAWYSAENSCVDPGCFCSENGNYCGWKDNGDDCFNEECEGDNEFSCRFTELEGLNSYNECHDYAESSEMEFHGAWYNAENACVDPGCFCNENDNHCNWIENGDDCVNWECEAYPHFSCEFNELEDISSSDECRTYAEDNQHGYWGIWYEAEDRCVEPGCFFNEDENHSVWIDSNSCMSDCENDPYFSCYLGELENISSPNECYAYAQENEYGYFGTWYEAEDKCEEPGCFFWEDLNHAVWLGSNSCINPDCESDNYYLCNMYQVQEPSSPDECRIYAEGSENDFGFYTGVSYDAENSCVEPGCYCNDNIDNPNDPYCEWKESSSSQEFADVTFRVNMSGITVHPEGVYLAGGDLGQDGFLMDDSDGDDIWVVTISLGTNNTYLYKFRNQPSYGTWEGFESWDGLIEGGCTAGEWHDRYFDLQDMDIVLDIVDYGSCYFNNCSDGEISCSDGTCLSESQMCNGVLECEIGLTHDIGNDECFNDCSNYCEDHDSDYGCADPNACNYDPNVEFDDNSCWYPEGNFDCEGNFYDCNGDMNGDAIYDYCGVCGGENAIDLSCYDFEYCASTLTIVGYQDSSQSSCVGSGPSASGVYTFLWDGGCPSVSIEASTGWFFETDPNWNSIWMAGFEPSSPVSFNFTFLDGTNIEFNNIVNDCPDCGDQILCSNSFICADSEEECTVCGDGQCNYSETYDSCPSDCYYYADCQDDMCDDSLWHDIDGEQYNCEAYAANNWCEQWGDYPGTCGLAANDACCTCQEDGRNNKYDKTQELSYKGAYLGHGFAANNRDDLCLIGPDIGCDGYCFSEAYENEMGDCVYDENNCSGYADDASLIENVYDSEECQAIADSDDDLNWEGFHCDSEMHCVEPGCYQFDNYVEWQDECDGPSACLSDCPDIDILIAFFDEGEGDLNGEDICSVFVSWLDTDCIYDCDDGEINEWEETGDICSECILNGDCDGIFFNNDDMPECLEDCSNEILNLEPFDDPDYYCELALSEETMDCFNDCDEDILQSIAETQNICSECLEANNCEDQFTNDDCGNAMPGTGDLDEDGELTISDIIMMLDNIIMFDLLDECQISIADLNDDGEVNIYDIVRAVDIILGGDNLSRFVGKLLHAPTTIELLQGSKSLDFNLDKQGLVGFDFIVSHGPDFSIQLNDEAFVSRLYTSNDQTRIMMVIDGGDHLFSTTSRYKIEEMVVGTIDGEIDNIKINHIPESFILSEIYPNPFNPSASFELSMPVKGFASVKIYNIVGQVVGVIHEGNLAANTYSFTWNANDLASGMYLVRAEANGEIAIQKMMLMK